MVKYCANCGRELPDEAMYCPECGKKCVPRSRADDSSSIIDGSGSSSKKEDEISSSSSSENINSSSAPGPSKKSSNLPDWKCLLVLAILLIFGLIGAATHNSNSYDSSVFSDNANDLYDNNYNFNNQNIPGKGSIERNEPYNMSIDKTAYLSGVGEVKLIDFNHSYNIESNGFNITEYETYYVNVNDDDWYVLDIFKCKFDTPAQSQVYSTDESDGDPIIIYSAKGDYYGYGIIIPNTSDNSKYKNIDFLQSIFHYKKE